ncbi:Metalloendopeptidase [Aphelenchoides besseyi]|nr:Metalloendopeptidase [Aphelenchoides besseyi]
MKSAANSRSLYFVHIKFLSKVFILILLTSIVADCSITHKDIVDKDQDAEETVLSSKDFENAPDKEIDLRKLGIEVPDDPTMGSKAEGDIAVPNVRRFMDDKPGLGRNAIRQSYRRWPNNEIPYTLSTQYGTYSRSVIAKAMNEYHQKTCVKFVARDPKRHRDYIYIHPDDGCYSLVGRVGGRQPLSLDSGCIQTGTIVHELMHTVGFFHEQSRYDRDQYIDIIWSNVINGADDQFEKYGMNVIDQLNEPYDYQSIMHYGPFAFSSNGKRTIVARKSGAQKMGQRVQFSEIDLRKINRLYQCGSTRSGSSSAPAALPAAAVPRITNSRPQETHFVIHPHTSSITITSGASGSQTNNRPIPNTQPITPIDMNECTDKNWRCTFWSMSIFGYCEQFEEIRDEVCAYSCGTCTAQRMAQSDCADKSGACERIHEQSCSSPLTQLMCPRSCGICGDSPSRELNCVDLSDSETCEHVRNLQLCDVRIDCAKSCGVCG